MVGNLMGFEVCLGWDTLEVHEEISPKNTQKVLKVRETTEKAEKNNR
jgi:hypothetical protein